MGRVRRSGTAPELALRAAIREYGVRHRPGSGAGLPGTPDLAFWSRRLAVFVDGCFWHGCPRHGTQSKTNTSFWAAKILRNRERDRQVDRALRRLEWRVLRLWEHQLRGDLAAVVERIELLVRARVGSTGGAPGDNSQRRNHQRAGRSR